MPAEVGLAHARLSGSRDPGRIVIGVAGGLVLFLVGLFLLIDGYYQLTIHVPIILSWWYFAVDILLFVLGSFAFRWGSSRKRMGGVQNQALSFLISLELGKYVVLPPT